MLDDWKQAESALSHIQVIKQGENELVKIEGEISDLQCIGIGTDAAVFVHTSLPTYAYKLYTIEALSKKQAEIEVYQHLKGSPYFPVYYGSGDRYIVISNESGVTLYDCLLNGLAVPRQVIDDVEAARQFVRGKGLNPRDIHLKNILLQNGRGKVLDVSEYVQAGNDNRWEHLVWAYENFYPLIEGKKVSRSVLEAVKKRYYRLVSTNGSVLDFANRLKRWFTRRIK